MTIPTVNKTPFIRTFRKFPQDPTLLEPELSRAYLDIANQINSREIALFFTGVVNTGQQWGTPSNGQAQQAFRQVFTIPSTAAGATTTIAHGITSISMITRLFGVAQTASDYRPLPYASTTANANIELKIDSTNITIVNGAASLNISGGNIVVEWLP